MSRLIDADKLPYIKAPIAPILVGDEVVWCNIVYKLHIDNAPTVDAVPVVRCKDCRYGYDDMGGLCCSHGVCVDCVVPEDFFCRYGKRKGGDE